MTVSLDKAVLDAAAAGLPVVSSNPASRTLLNSDVSIGACDATAQSLTDTIGQMLSMNEAERAALGSSLRSPVVEEHALPKPIDAMLAKMRSDQTDPSCSQIVLLIRRFREVVTNLVCF